MVDDSLEIRSDNDFDFTLKPDKVIKTVNFMAEIGSIKQTPATLADLFFRARQIEWRLKQNLGKRS